MAAETAAGGDVWGVVAFQLGGGALLGFAAGYALKKILKLVLLVVGVFTLGLLYMEYKGWVTINYDALVRDIENAISGGASTAASLKAHLIANVPFASAFMLGFALGFKKG